MNTPLVTAYAPIHGFRWSGGDFEVGPGLFIKRLSVMPNVRGLETNLTRSELQSSSGAHHWLTFEVQPNAGTSPEEIISLFTLSLWLAKTTETHIRLCFLIDLSPEADRQTVKRFGDRFESLPGDRFQEVSDADMREASSYYSSLWSLYRTQRRLNDALLLTIAGCRSPHWSAALICHSAAIEAMLTYSTRPGAITRRLAVTSACLLETETARRDTAFREFLKLYEARSDIIHGRTHNVPEPNRLETLRELQNLLRRLWRTVLVSPSLASTLEGTDATREAHFLSGQSGYTPPKR